MVQTLTIENSSPVAVPFTVAAESRGVFAVDRRFGELPPQLPSQLSITFRPTSACNSWKRLSICLGSTDPVEVDLLGTGYSPEARPPPLNAGHVDAFLARIALGGSIAPPAQCEDGSVPAAPLQLREDVPAAAGPSGRQGWDLLFLGQDCSCARSVTAGADICASVHNVAKRREAECGRDEPHALQGGMHFRGATVAG